MDEYQFQWSTKLPNGEIFLARSSTAEGLFAQRQAIQSLLPKEAQHQAPPKVYQPADPNQELESIEIDSIKLASGGDHPRWVVMGGWAKQFGITCWPETLQAAGLLATLDPLKENLVGAGYRAYYTKKVKKDDPSKMTADKVVKIVRLGATPDDVFGTDEGVLPF